MAIVQDTLHALGITRNYKGYYHTVYAIELVLADEDRLESVIKEIYFVTAQHFGCHWTSVERNIRTIVQHAWRVNPTLLGKMAGYPLTDVPTVSEFLEIISAHILRLALKSR